MSMIWVRIIVLFTKRCRWETEKTSGREKMAKVTSTEWSGSLSVSCSVTPSTIWLIHWNLLPSVINEHSSDQRVLIKTVNKLMQRSHESLYQPSPSNALLAYSFADFITTKGEKIHTALVARNIDLSLADDDELPINAAELNKFHEFSQEDVKEFASQGA